MPEPRWVRGILQRMKTLPTPREEKKGERKEKREIRPSYRPDYPFFAFHPPLAGVAVEYVKVAPAAKELLNTSPLSGGFLAT